MEREGGVGVRNGRMQESGVGQGGRWQALRGGEMGRGEMGGGKMVEDGWRGVEGW